MSMRSLTASVRPASGPAPAGAGSTRVMNALKGSALTARAPRTRSRPSRLRRRAAVPRRASTPAASSPNTSWRSGLILRAVVDVGEEDRDLHDVLEAAPARGEHGAHVVEHLPRLRDDVVATHEPAGAVDGHDPRDVQEPAGTHGVGEVRDRLGEPVDADLLTAHESPLRSLSFTRGLILSGSTGSSSTAGLPDASARSKAPSKSSVRSTRSP